MSLGEQGKHSDKIEHGYVVATESGTITAIRACWPTVMVQEPRLNYQPNRLNVRAYWSGGGILACTSPDVKSVLSLTPLLRRAARRRMRVVKRQLTSTEPTTQMAISGRFLKRSLRASSNGVAANCVMAQPLESTPRVSPSGLNSPSRKGRREKSLFSLQNVGSSSQGAFLSDPVVHPLIDVRHSISRLKTAAPSPLVCIL